MAKDLILIQEEPRGPSQLVEVNVTANGLQRVNFPDVQQLRSYANQVVVLKGMRLITADVLTNGVIGGFPAAPVTELQKIVLVLYCQGWEKAQYIPLITMNDIQLLGGTAPNAGSPMRFDDWKNVDWSKSYLQFANGTVSAITGTGYTVMFDVLYQKFAPTVTGTLEVIEGAS